MNNPDELRFDGRVALVTGAGAGLGRAYAAELSRRGATVVVNDIALASDGRAVVAHVAEQLRAAGGSVIPVPGDISVEEDAVAAVERTVAECGRIDILVNNAGIGGRDTATDCDTSALRRVLDVNVLGSFWTQRAALRYMEDQAYGRIVNAASAGGIFGAAELFAYAVSKAAVWGMTRSAALSYPDADILVNAVAPYAKSGMAGPYFDAHPEIDTSLLEPECCAPAVVYLAHDSCELRGEVLAVGGGRAAHIFAATHPGIAEPGLTAEHIAGQIDKVMSTEGMHVLRSSIEQTRLLPTFS